MIIIGSDCSGICSLEIALKKLKIDYKSLFGSEPDKHCLKFLKENDLIPEIMFNDIKNKNYYPKLDLYICGIPCQPFSSSGKRLKNLDPRADIIDYAIQTIIKCEPKVFILENVPNFMNELLIEKLKILNYSISYQILNTKDYGIPQNRKRLYIIGTKEVVNFNFKKIECESIENFVDFSNTIHEEFAPNLLKKYENYKDSIFCNLDQIRPGNYKASRDYCSTITRSNPIYNVLLHRKATNLEYLKLQGLPTNLKCLPVNQMRKLVGNSMSINILEMIIRDLETHFIIN